ncbi:MAG: hypothetical protein K6E98_11765 [Lachnospiraceae bacterium]|nr:hypothetical protein [Lachnospiraceae bacterium]
MSVISVLLIIIWAFIVPYLLGMFVLGATGVGKIKTVGKNIAYGFMFMCVLFILPAIPMILLHVPFHILKYTWVFEAVFFGLAGIVFAIKDYKETALRKADKTEKSFPEGLKKSIPDKETLIIWTGAILIIAFETALLTLRMHIDTDDARFIVDAMEAISRDTMLEHNPITGFRHGLPVGEQIKDVTAPYPIFIALMSQLFRLHPAILAHTVMPFLYIPLSYVVFFLAGNEIFNGNIRKTGLFMLFLSLIHLFSFETIYSAGYTLLTIIWQGRSVVAMIMLPFLWYLLLVLSNKEERAIKDYLIIMLAALACAMLSNMGSVFAVLLCMAYAFSVTCAKRTIKPFVGMGLSLLPVFAIIVLSRLLYSGILYK